MNCPKCNSYMSYTKKGWYCKKCKAYLNSEVPAANNISTNPQSLDMPRSADPSSSNAQTRPIDPHKDITQPPHPQKKGHGCLVVVLIFLGLFACGLLFGIYQMLKNPDEYNTSRMSAKYIDVTTEEGLAIDEVLKACGIATVQNIEHDTILDGTYGEGNTGYRIQYTYDIGNIIMYLTPDKSVYILRYVDHDLYANGNTIATIQDYTFTMAEMTDLQIQCQSLVKEILKSPSTAKFPSITKWNFMKEKNIVTIQGYVDAQNSFGAEIRSVFQFIIDTDTKVVNSFIFDGQELIGNDSSAISEGDTNTENDLGIEESKDTKEAAKYKDAFEKGFDDNFSISDENKENINSVQNTTDEIWNDDEVQEAYNEYKKSLKSLFAN